MGDQSCTELQGGCRYQQVHRAQYHRRSLKFCPNRSGLFRTSVIKWKALDGRNESPKLLKALGDFKTLASTAEQFHLDDQHEAKVGLSQGRISLG